MIHFIDIVLKVCISVFAVLLTATFLIVFFIAVREVIRERRK